MNFGGIDHYKIWAFLSIKRSCWLREQEWRAAPLCHLPRWTLVGCPMRVLSLFEPIRWAKLAQALTSTWTGNWCSVSEGGQSFSHTLHVIWTFLSFWPWRPLLGCADLTHLGCLNWSLAMGITSLLSGLKNKMIGYELPDTLLYSWLHNYYTCVLYKCIFWSLSV